MTSTPSPIRPRRSALYMPASNARAMEKARTLAADAVIFDLEDAVAPEAKDAARRQACQAVRQGGYGRREVVIRVNGLATAWGKADLAAAGHAGVDALLIPKVQSANQLAAVREALAEADVPGSLALWAMIETPLGVLNAREIAAAAAANHYPLTVFVMGGNDLAKETRAAATPDRLPLLTWLSHTVLAARAFGLDVLDGVYNDIADRDGFARECRQARELGFDGKTLIHPSQIDPCNAAFAPSPQDVAWARKVIAAFDDPANRGKGAIGLDGRMVELMHRDSARRTLALADAIAEGEQA